MKDLAILVTGGAGFIGSHLVDLLMETGHTVFVMDDLSTGRLDNIQRWSDDDRFMFIRGDVSEPLDSVLTPSKLGGAPPIGHIFHLAARVDVTSSFQNPAEDIRVNYLGTLNVLEYAMKTGVKKVGFASSAAIFGDTPDVPVAEDAAKMPLSPYGLNKLSSENLLRIYREQYGIGYVSMRFFNVYGERQGADSPYSGVISRFLDRAISREPLMIYGDGGQTRDFIYVGDVARLMVMAAGSNFSGELNVGTGKETSITELAETVIKLAGTGSGIINLPERKGEIRRSVADIERMDAHLGPLELTDLKEGLARTLKWHSLRRAGERVVP
ncbi:MAG: NAD-dependent epimerase/dehydratase family protein, partial [Thermoplasmatota archaeon]